MMETIALIAKNNPQFSVITPTRVGESDKGKYLVYEINKANETTK